MLHMHRQGFDRLTFFESNFVPALFLLDLVYLLQSFLEVHKALRNGLFGRCIGPSFGERE